MQALIKFVFALKTKWELIQLDVVMTFKRCVTLKTDLKLAEQLEAFWPATPRW